MPLTLKDAFLHAEAEMVKEKLFWGDQMLLKSISLLFMSSLIVGAALAQERYTTEHLDYSLELPSPTWRAIPRPDGVHQHVEFVNGDRNDGYLQVRREVVESGITPSDLGRRDFEQKLRFLPGFIEGQEERFAGKLQGVTISYEYTSGGKPMAGRIYYLQADNRTVYVLRFTGMRDRLARIRNQTDLMARSFEIK